MSIAVSSIGRRRLHNNLANSNTAIPALIAMVKTSYLANHGKKSSIKPPWPNPESTRFLLLNLVNDEWTAKALQRYQVFHLERYKFMILHSSEEFQDGHDNNRRRFTKKESSRASWPSAESNGLLLQKLFSTYLLEVADALQAIRGLSPRDVPWYTLMNVKDEFSEGTNPRVERVASAEIVLYLREVADAHQALREHKFGRFFLNWVTACHEFQMRSEHHQAFLVPLGCG
ncbi:hypothetical protein DFH07DRAFT_774622 [Mycena maculata]|uniref:Uncharacterized protein n=1 Tax=Mycena maculata TaxID=230809 RepID=A0AAD7N9V5_9AGAR|nr:hypothetical protein DFH07DRAFT_774622 [Mycena maculata]